MLASKEGSVQTASAYLYLSRSLALDCCLYLLCSEMGV